MPTATKKRKPTAAEQRAVLGSLSQQVAAELVGKPSIWLRDHPEIAVRNDDDTYDARTLVRNMIGAQPAADLPPDLMEGILQVVENTIRPDGRHDLAYAAFSTVERQYGAAGLAAIGAEMLEHLSEWARLDPDAHPRDLTPETEYVEAAAERARQRHRLLAKGWSARQDGRELYVCHKCGKYRLGKKWSQPPLPSGYVESTTTGAVCPKCRNR